MIVRVTTAPRPQGREGKAGAEALFEGGMEEEERWEEAFCEGLEAGEAGQN